MTLAFTDSLDSVKEGALRWITRSFWAVSDQGFFAVSNFALNVLLARWLMPQEFGSFVLAYTIFLLLATIHNGLIIEPLLVFGSSNYRDQHSMYRAAMLQLHVLFSIPLAIVLAGAAAIAWWMGNTDMAGALGTLSIAGPMILLLWMMRRICYLVSAPRRSAIAGMFYTVLMVLAMLGVQHFGRLGIVQALCILGGCSLICAIGLMFSEHVHWPRPQQRQMIRQVHKIHLRYGRWASAGGLAGFVPAQVYYLLLPVLISTQAAGILRGLTNPSLPMQHVITAISVLMLPRLSAAWGSKNFHRITELGAALVCLVAIVYWIVCGIFHAPLVYLMYGGGDSGSAFMQQSWLLWVIGLQAVLQAMTSIYGTAVVAMQRPDWCFYAQLASSAVALTAGIFLTKYYGVAGACFAILINLAVQAILLIYFAYRKSPVSSENTALADSPPASACEVQP